MIYQVIEDNGGGIYLFVFDEADNVIAGFENLEYAQPGDLDTLTEDAISTWDSRLDQPQGHYDALRQFFSGQVVADQNAVYPERMGRAAKLLYRAFEIVIEYDASEDAMYGISGADGYDQTASLRMFERLLTEDVRALYPRASVDVSPGRGTLHIDGDPAHDEVPFVEQALHNVWVGFGWLALARGTDD